MTQLPYNPLSLDGKRFLITGASSGIGRTVSAVLSKLGASLVLVGRNREELESTLSRCANPDQHCIETRDMSDLDTIPQWVREVRARVDAPLNGFVHAAGVGTASPIRAMTSRRIDEILHINFHAALMLLRGVTAKGVLDAAGGACVLLSSVAAHSGTRGLAVYGASKGALEAATMAAASELADRKFRVNCVAPGYVDTPMVARAQEELPGYLDHVNARQIFGMIDPEEVGVATAYLLSDAARHVSGTTLMLDAGYLL